MDEIYEFEDDAPWADPSIRLAYEAALGRLILAHNEVDYRLTALLRLAIGTLGTGDAIQKLAVGNFAHRLTSVAILQAVAPECGLAGFDVEQLQRLNRERNILAYGHFDQNPYDGTYDVVESEKYKINAILKRQNYPIEKINRVTEELKKIAGQQHATEVLFDFRNIDQTSSTNRP